jgi:hypothetical protein
MIHYVGDEAQVRDPRDAPASKQQEPAVRRAAGSRAALFLESYGFFSDSFDFVSVVVVFAGVVGLPQPMPTATSIAPRMNAAMILFTVEPSFREDIQTCFPGSHLIRGGHASHLFSEPRHYDWSETIVLTDCAGGRASQARP